MPCTTAKTKPELTLMEKALQELEADITAGKKRIIQTAYGLQITSWSTSSAAKAKWCEGCALRKLQTSSSYAVRAQLAQQGITAQPFVVASHKGHKH